jgi:hypothetical protein
MLFLDYFVYIVGELRPDRIGKNYVVLDLDSTLLYTLDESNYDKFERTLNRSNHDLSTIVYKIPDGGSPTADHSTYAFGVKRPNTDLFLRFCLLYFRGVCVWSAGAPVYVRKMVEELFTGMQQPLIVLDRSNCSVDGNGRYYKPLDTLYRMVPDMNEYNTWVIDDNPVTIQANPANGILVPPYTVAPTLPDIQRDDSVFPILMWFFMSEPVLACNDVRQLRLPNLH